MTTRRHHDITTMLATLITALLLMVAGNTRAAKVTYHVLTLPINATEAHMVSAVNGKRLEAVRAVVDNATTIELPAHFKSPLAKNFKYYRADQVEKSAVTELHSGSNRVKGYIYSIKGELTGTTDDDETPVTEGTAVDANCDIYVTYEYNAAENTIAKLDGSKEYIIGVKKGFLALNRGRNNRPAVVPKDMVTDAQLISEDFVKVNVNGSGIGTYWSSGDNKMPKASVESQFHFVFKLEGNDPYNIIIRTAYAKDSTYMEKEANNKKHYKYYKESSLFAPSTNNAYLASDEHREYNIDYVDNTPFANYPRDLTEGTDKGWTDTPGFFHGQVAPIWSTFALLNNTTGDGYVFMGSRTYKSNGDFENVGGSYPNYQYKYLKFDNANLTINNQTPANATTNYSTDQYFYEIKTINFKVTTPFYDKNGTTEQKAAHTVSASVKMSEYKIRTSDILGSDIPKSLERKYCTFTGFYKDAALSQEITTYAELEGATDVYLKYEVSATIPFKAIKPAATYSDATWKAATWYELTDGGSKEENGKKLKYDGTSTTFKNNGAHNKFTKTSEYAFIGDPYELQVVLRSATSDNSPSYVGAASAGNLGISTTDGDGYHWEIEDDDTDGSFLLRRYGGTGYWSWDAGHRSENISYTTAAHSVSLTYGNAQTVTFNISNLTYADGNYIKVTSGGTDAAQVISTTPTLTTGIGGVTDDGTATVTANIAANSSGASKTFTLTITEYNKSNAVVGTATVITVTQGYAAYSGNTVEYSTTSSTRVKALELSKAKYTYKIVDKSGRIAVMATTTQPIYSPLSIASIPSIIVSPFILDETVKFYDDNYVDGAGRSTLTHKITEAPDVDNPEVGATIYVTYTTGNLKDKPFRLSEDQEIFVKLNGQYVYYDGGTLKSSAEKGDSDTYKWKLRNRDPYAMLLDNIGARSTSGNESVTVYADDGSTTTAEREVGAWVKLATTVGDGVALAFDTDRDNAQPFIAKSSARAGMYEVMVATGDGVDASTTYYNIGRPDATTVKIYSNATYQAGDDEEIKFVLEENEIYTYHLIDKSKHELLTVDCRSPELVLPAEYQSPLVGTANYSYYGIDQFNVSGEGANAVYTLKVSPTKLTNISGLLATYHYTTTSSDATNSWTEASTVDDMESAVKKLKVAGHYYYKVVDTYYDVEVTKPYYTDIYVTYEKNNLVTFNDNGHPYLLKFLNPYAAGYYLENGGDKIEKDEKRQAVYPYTNGDGSLFIYGTEMNEEQMGGGANTRPRWIWYFTNPSGYTDDPYHVTIHSRSPISYNGVSHPTYLKTEAINFNQDAAGDPKHVITRGALPGITSERPTEYMILGTPGNYRLVTTDLVDGARRTVNSLEQYWKTYNIVKLDVLRISAKTDAYSEEPETFVVPTEDDPETEDVDESTYRTTLANRGWHSYEVYANATRWNGYNDKSDGAGKKVVEKLEHWFQTFDMGNGAFDIESANIPPVLVLLDRHGWEIMRKPLPTVATYPNGDELEALRAYDSPMVKEYHFFSNAAKASGCHKYSLREQNGALRDEIKVGGTAYTSTSLGALPPITAKGVKDSYGFIQDFYVTYTVKEEYEKSYTYSLAADSTTVTETRSKFLVLQNGRFLKKKNDDKESYISKPIWEHVTGATNAGNGNVYDLILSPKNGQVITMDGDKMADYNYWYIGPNLDIDREMGITWGASNSGAEPLTEKATKALYDPNKTKLAYMQTTGFDPYNMQIKNADASINTYITSNMTSATLTGGEMVGGYTSDPVITLQSAATTFVNCEGYDHTKLQITNQTFMAVSDANGNMQLMPRFDHTKRIDTDKSSPYYTTLKDPVDNAVKATVDNNNSMTAQTTFLVRPQVQEYLIIDNQGREALRYKRAGEYYPAITEHFKSPLAKDFSFYKTLPDADEDGVYEINDIADEITGSFAEAGLDGDSITVYVRYKYNESYDKDNDNILQGKWFTMKLSDKDVQSTETTINAAGNNVFLYSGTKSSDEPIDATDAKRKWQWKFLQAPMDPSSDYYTPVDPYAIELYNRKANYSTDLSSSSPMSVPIKVNGCDRFALLSHPDGGYVLAVDGLGTYTYRFLNGANMTTSVAATTFAENRQKITVDNETAYTTAKAALSVDGEYYYKYGNGDEPLTYSYKKVTRTNGVTDTGEDITEEDWNNGEQYNFNVKLNALSPSTQLILNDDVEYNYEYRVINNAGTLAVSATQTKAEAAANGYAPSLPEAAQTPLLNMEDYTYYAYAVPTDPPSNTTYSVIPYSIIATIAGGYDDVIWVRYEPFNRETTPFSVPNVRNATDTGTVAVDAESNDVAFDISGNLPYNIIWLNDKMMTSTDGTSITNGGSHSIDGDDDYVWKFEGDDPYAIKIKNNGGKYVDGTATLNATAKNFMLLKRQGYDYGVLAETGNQGTMLSDYGQTTTTGDPTKYIIFALSVHKLIYHLAIANTNNNISIPYREGTEDSYKTGGWATYENASPNTLEFKGTTQRDLTNYAIADFDAGHVGLGDILEVPGTFYRPNCNFLYYVEGIYSDDACTIPNADLNNRYKGLNVEKLMSGAALIGYTVKVNVRYTFNTGLETNSGDGFVMDVDDNLWYTYEANAATPKLAQYTGSLQTVSGYATHYTNDYLWTPLGDPYGFKMYNRYMYKNLGQASTVMTTTDFSEGRAIELSSANADKSVYELLADAFTTAGYFKVHPVANTVSPYYYMRDDGGALKLSTTATEWTYGLSEDVMRPYYERAGYVGGLNAAGKAAYETAAAITTPFTKLVTLQDVVYNHDNDGSDPENPNYIVHYTPGYYRLHNQPGSEGISTVRYASGYLHKLESNVDGDEDESDAIPMHFYSREGVLTSFGDEGLKDGYTKTNATQGDIPIAPTENDPSTIFYFDGANGSVTVSTQDLKVIGNKMTTGDGTAFTITDIGGAVVALSGNNGDGTKYLLYDQSSNIYDLKFSASGNESARWCMAPANNLGLKVTMNDGGDGYYYATFYAPFDVLLPAGDGDKKYYAYVCDKWDDKNMHPTKVEAHSPYAAGRFVPANTPVIFRTTDTSGSISLTLPTSTPALSPLTCDFIGQYLEQMLAVDADHYVYTFGLPFTSDIEINRSDGSIDSPGIEQATTGVGFYINANPNKEADESQSLWLRNNRYVQHNKIYYRGTGAGARQDRAPQFVPVIFDDEEDEQELLPDGSQEEMAGDGCIYDLSGRKLVDEQRVKDGTWRTVLAPGIYILNGRKFSKK